jgi:hypothetical protein
VASEHRNARDNSDFPEPEQPNTKQYRRSI